MPQNEGAEKNFGSSFGFAMALLATDQNISSEKAVGLVKGWETFEERKFSYQRSIRHDMRGIGCRHVDLASKKEYEKLYGIPSGKVIEMRNYVLNNEEMIAQVSALIGGDSVAGGNRS